MLERFWEYISRHFKSAWKSVFFNFKQYCCFFAAIFIIQMLYGMMAISATNNNSVAYQQIVEEYDYHYVIRNLTQGQYNYLEGYKRSQNMGILDKNKQLYVIVDTTERYNEREGKNVYDVYLRFGKEGADAATVQKYYKEFKQFYVDKLASLEPSYAYQDPNQTNFSVENTLLLDYQSRVSGNNTTFWIITALLLVLSVFLLMSIYNIRMNQYKFTYGVYMTFGADFKKLFVTAFWEMFVVMIVTFIPSVLVSTLVVWLIYAPSGFSFAFSGWVFFKVFVFSLFVVLAAVFMPMRTTSARQPMSLIITEDNSNLVTSPRKSFNLMGKKFPGNYEMYSLWRFRKYNIQLLTTAIVFCALFICGLYLANIYDTNVNYPRPQFNVTIDPNNTNAAYDYKLSSDIKSVNEEFKEEYGEELSEYGEDFAENFEALTYIESTGNATPVDGDVDFSQSPVTEAKYISSFMLVNKKNIKPFSTGFFVFKQEDAYSRYDDGKGGSYKVTNNVLYRAVSEDTSEDLFEFLSQYTVEGDPTQILESKGDTQYVIIGDSISNISKFKFKVGDTIAVSTYEGAVTAVDSNLTGKNLLRKQIQNFKYRYTTLTVCAIIKDIPSGSVPVYMMDDVYESVAGRSAVTTKLNLYTYSADPA
ncbi:MAG: ABC transporter permease, partial [Candidatus Avispirillum sp.]